MLKLRKAPSLTEGHFLCMEENVFSLGSVLYLNSEEFSMLTCLLAAL